MFITNLNFSFVAEFGIECLFFLHQYNDQLLKYERSKNTDNTETYRKVSAFLGIFVHVFI